MDHLPSVVGAAEQPELEVPFLCKGFQYNGLHFKDYHQPKERELFKRSSFLERQRLAPEMPFPASELPFIQSWLFFGTLSEVFNIFWIQIDVSRYVNEREKVTTLEITLMNGRNSRKLVSNRKKGPT